VHPLIRAARTAQTRAVRAALRVGPAHPRTRLLLAAAAVAAAAAWEAGHRVADIHPLPPGGSGKQIPSRPAARPPAVRPSPGQRPLRTTDMRGEQLHEHQ